MKTIKKASLVKWGQVQVWIWHQEWLLWWNFVEQNKYLSNGKDPERWPWWKLEEELIA